MSRVRKLIASHVFCPKCHYCLLLGNLPGSYKLSSSVRHFFHPCLLIPVGFVVSYYRFTNNGRSEITGGTADEEIMVG